MTRVDGYPTAGADGWGILVNRGEGAAFLPHPIRRGDVLPDHGRYWDLLEFDSEAAAQAWYDDFEKRMAALE